MPNLLSQAEILHILERERVIQRGHHVLSAGQHSDVRFDEAPIARTPHLAKTLGEAIGRRFEQEFTVTVTDRAVDVPLAFSVALAEGTRFSVVQSAGTLQESSASRTDAVRRGDRALMVRTILRDDDYADPLTERLRQVGAQPVGLGGVVRAIRRDAQNESRELFKALVSIEQGTWPESECPLCRDQKEISFVEED